MTDYTQSTSFTAKDALPSGHPGKKILGSLFDTEFNNISVAISTKLESGDSASFAPGTVISDFTFTDGELTTASPILSLNNPVGITGTLSVVGDVSTAGFVNGRSMSVDGAKLDGIETGATADQTDAEIKTAYENNADTNAYSDAEKAKLAGIEAGADVTDTDNVAAAGAVLTFDEDASSFGFVIDDDSFASASSTKVPTSESVEARINTRLTAIGAVMVDPTPTVGQYARFKDAFTIEGADLNNDSTLGSLTKTFVTNEAATITLSSVPTGQPVVSVSKEIPQVGVSSNQWDVNATDENYTRTNYAHATTLDFSYTPTVAKATDSGNSLDVSANVSAGGACTFSNDGTKFFILDVNGGDISEYSLAVAYDLSTATYTDAFLVSGQDSTPEGMHFKPDGTKVYVVGRTNDSVFQYDLSTAWDISSAVYASKSVSVALEDTNPTDVTFSNDGTVMMVVGNSSNTVYQYDLSTAWDVSSAVYASKFLSVTSKESTPRGLELSSDGKKIWVAGNSSDAIHEYTLSSANNVNTGSFTVTLSLPGSWAVYGIGLDENINRAYAIDITADVVYEYTLRDAYSGTLTLGTGSFASTEVGMSIYANGGRFVLSATNGSASVAETPSRYTTQVASGDWEMYGTIFNSTTGQLEISNAIQPGVIEGSALISSLDVSLQTTNPRGVRLSPDGTHLYVLATNSDTIKYYTLSTPYDVSTATYDTDLSVNPQEASPSAIELNPDGTKIYCVGTSNATVFAYNMSTPYDLGTASYSGQSKSVTSEETQPKGLWFKPDGTIMFVAGATKSIHAYDLSAAWDVSTAVFNSVEFSAAAEANSAEFVWFSVDGTSMYIGGSTSGITYEYELSNAWDVSTASYTGISALMGGGSNSVYDVAPIGDGDRIVVANDSLNTVRFIGLGNFVVRSGASAAVTSASTDTTYWTDINNMTPTDDAGSGVVYYAVSTDDRTTWSIIDETLGVRDIVRNNAGTWEYNSNATYALETWVAGTTNAELATLEEATGGINLDDASDFRIIFATDSGNASDFEMNTAGFTDIVDAPNQTTPDLNAFATFTSTVEAVESVSIATNNASCRTVSVNAAINASAYSQVSALSTTTVSLSGITVGSLLIYVASTTDHTASLSPPTGYTLINNAASTQDALFVFYKVADSTSENITNVGELDYLIEFTVAGGTPVVRSGTYVSSTTESTSVFNLAGAGIVYLNQMDKAQLSGVGDANHFTLANDLDLAIIMDYTGGGFAPASDGAAINYDANTLDQGAVLGLDYDWDYPASDKVRITALQSGNYKVRVV